ncbi:MAG TPA: single-stranded DNA-binding protein, partial [Spirochaetia bacterium]|nr:single-stranded DNA-binding protein [Spirochaetia bacterium]
MWEILAAFNRALARLSFSSPVTHVYNPHVYAREPYQEYCRTYGRGVKRAVFMGMNPGPWGMVQTGIPFGEVD